MILGTQQQDNSEIKFSKFKPNAKKTFNHNLIVACASTIFTAPIAPVRRITLVVI